MMRNFENSGAAMMPDLLQWNRKITCSVKQGYAKEALEILKQMCLTGALPNSHAVSSTLKACYILGDLENGRLLHCLCILSMDESSAYVNSALINFYAKSRYLEDALHVFENTVDLDVVSYNSMITGYLEHGYAGNVIALYHSLCYSMLIPTDVTLTSVLSACAKLGNFKCGKQIHRDVLVRSTKASIYVNNTLIDMYSKCHSIEDAWDVFIKMPEHDSISWNLIIAAYAKHGPLDKAFMIFQQMLNEGIQPGDRTFVSILNACQRIENHNQGKQLHTLVEELFECDTENTIVYSSVIDMYTKCGSMKTATELFEKVPRIDVVVWNVIITANANHGCKDKALELYDRMGMEGISPNEITLLGVLNTSGCLKALERGKDVHAFMTKTGICSEIVLGNSLIDMYGKCKNLVDAHYVFDNMSDRDVISWTVMIAGHMHNEQQQDGFTMYNKMQSECVLHNEVTFMALLNGITSKSFMKKGEQIHCQLMFTGLKNDLNVLNSLIHMYANSRSLKKAHEMFNNMTKQDSATWNALTSGYAKYGDTEEALKLFLQMKVEGLVTGEVSYASILDALARQAAFDEGKRFHVAILNAQLESSVFVGSALIDLYAKCGNLDCAHHVLEKMRIRDVGVWGALITAYAQHGCGKKTLELAAQMCEEGIKLNDITLISILSACSHSGLVNEGCYFSYTMREKHNIRPTVKHYACMVDLLSRAGQLDEAHDLILKMPVKASAPSWMALLSACKMYGNVDLARIAAQKVYQLEPQNTAAFCLLFDTCASSPTELYNINEVL